MVGTTFENFVDSTGATKDAEITLLDHPRDDTWAAEVEKVETMMADEKTTIDSVLA